MTIVLTAGSSRSAFAERMLRRRLLIWPPVLNAANSAPPAALHITPAVNTLPGTVIEHAAVHMQCECYIRARCKAAAVDAEDLSARLNS